MKIYITLFLVVFSLGFLYAQDNGGGKYSIKNLEINTPQADFGTAFYGENKIVFASPRKGFSVVRDVWEENGERFLDLYEGVINERGDITEKMKLKGEVNSRYHEAEVIFSNDGKTVYFTRNNYYNKRLGVSSKETTNLAMFKAVVNDKGEWINIIPMPFNNVEYSVGHPALSEDEKTLYFTSDMPGSLGDTDIFKVEVNQSGFGNPVNLGPKINSTAKDWFPFIDGDVLYFSSDRWGGKGGTDVYATRLEGFTPEPISLNAPINGSGDDYAFIINSETRKGYFSSNRADGKGGDDIYSFIEEEPVSFKCLQAVNGEVRDRNSGALLPGTEVVLSDKDDNVIESIIVKENATFSFEINCETEYKLEGKKVDYTAQAKAFTTSNEADKELQMKILLGKGDIDFIVDAGGNLTQDQQEDVKPEGLPDVLPDEIVKLRASTYAVNIDPIYFDFNSSYLTKRAKDELEKVVRLMNQYPKMIIESASHTDSQGPDGINLWLSDKRAKRTVDYIISRGIDSSRITGKGYGATQLINQCVKGVQCTDAQHEKNRRSEFVIIRM